MVRSDRVRLEIRVNDGQVCTAGVDGFGVVSAIVTWVLRDPAKRPDNRDVLANDWSRQKLDVNLGGLRLEMKEHVTWAHQHLKVGDEIRIRVLGPGPVDEPLGS